ncbi:MAG: DNA polymerase III subunit delta' [Candidatus Nanopelagicales bacterium]|nr:DNA polymerase III subunit delta' [Candidatus Nanopelagicales bacterium]
MTVWDGLVGQGDAVETLRAASLHAGTIPVGPSMTHAWLITGPPGSGRSTAAIAFARALMCDQAGCGDCPACRDVSAGGHPDVEIVRPQGLSYRTDDARALVNRAFIAPSLGRWHVIVIEDADRLTEAANNVLLKAIEEPPPRAVWILCTPSAEDVLPTIRSRCRQIALRSPNPMDVADYLSSTEQVDHAVALFAARAAQGHVGRARALVRDEGARQRRQQILTIPSSLSDLGACQRAAEQIVATAKKDALAATQDVDQKELANLHLAWGEGAEGRGVKGGARGMKGAEKELTDRQNSRRTRTQRDQLDRALIDLLAFYRDVLAVQFAAENGEPRPELINEEIHGEVERSAQSSSPTETMRRINAVDHARVALNANVTPELAIGSLTIELRRPSLRRSI